MSYNPSMLSNWEISLLTMEIDFKGYLSLGIDHYGATTSLSRITTSLSRTTTSLSRKLLLYKPTSLL